MTHPFINRGIYNLKFPVSLCITFTLKTDRRTITKSSGEEYKSHSNMMHVLQNGSHNLIHNYKYRPVISPRIHFPCFWSGRTTTYPEYQDDKAKKPGQQYQPYIEDYPMIMTGILRDEDTTTRGHHPNRMNIRNEMKL